MENVQLVLLSNNDDKTKTLKAPKGCTATSASGDGMTLPKGVVVLCIVATDANGLFTFKGISPGSYLVVPVYK